MGTTHVIQVIDGSGSMAPFRTDVIGGFNSYVTDLAMDADQRYSVTAVVFSDVLDDIAQDQPPAVVSLTKNNYQPNGSTALYYAVGTVVTEFRNRWRGKLGADDKVLLVVNTDGEENYSSTFKDRHGEPAWTQQKVSALIRECEAAGWATLYIGAGPAAWNRERELGIHHGVNTRAEKTGETYVVLSDVTSKYSKGMVSNTAMRKAVEDAVGEVPDAA